MNAPNGPFSQPESTTGALRDCDARNCCDARTVSDAHGSSGARGKGILMADLQSGPFSNLGQLVARHSGMFFILIIEATTRRIETNAPVESTNTKTYFTALNEC